MICLWVTLLWTAGCRAAPRQQFTLVAADTDSEPAATVAAPARHTIALVMKTLTNPFFVEMERGARRAESEFDINLVVKTGAQETSIEQQITIVHELIEEGVDAIVIAPADSRELVPALQAAHQAGIQIVNVDNPLDPALMETMGLQDVPLITVDNATGAYLSARYIAAQTTGPIKAVILEGIRTAQNAEDRKQGALRAFAEFPAIEVVAMETANWKIDEAYSVVAGLFELTPDIGLVFAANDMMALGVLQYLEETGNSQVLVASYDAVEEAKTAIRAGALQATVNQQAEMQGYSAVRLAEDLLRGRAVPPVTFIDVQLITQSDLQTP
jgi:ribose transport system substrate-binding protein